MRNNMRYLMMIISVIWIVIVSLQVNAKVSQKHNNCDKININSVAKDIILKLLEQKASETKTIKLVVG